MQRVNQKRILSKHSVYPLFLLNCGMCFYIQIDSHGGKLRRVHRWTISQEGERIKYSSVRYFNLILKNRSGGLKNQMPLKTFDFKGNVSVNAVLAVLFVLMHPITFLPSSTDQNIYDIKTKLLQHSNPLFRNIRYYVFKKRKTYLMTC